MFLSLNHRVHPSRLSSLFQPLRTAPAVHWNGVILISTHPCSIPPRCRSSSLPGLPADPPRLIFHNSHPEWHICFTGLPSQPAVSVSKYRQQQRQRWQQLQQVVKVDGSIVFARWHQCAHPSNTCFLGTTRVHIPNGIWISTAAFAQLTGESPYTLQRATPFPPQNFPFTRDPDPHLTHGSLGPPESQRRIGISTGSAVTAEFTIMTDRPTDRQTDHVTPSVTIGHIYVVLKCGLTVFQTISTVM